MHSKVKFSLHIHSQAASCFCAVVMLFFAPVENSKDEQHHVTVVVMGDVGRYHDRGLYAGSASMLAPF